MKLRARALARSETSLVLMQAGWNGMGSLVGMGAQLVLTPYLIGALGADRYGIWALVTVMVSLVSTVDGGLGASLGFFFAAHRGRRDIAATSRLAASACVFVLAIGAVATLALGTLMPVLVRFIRIPAALHGEAESVRFLIGALVTAAVLSSVFTALLQAHERFRSVGIISAIRTAIMVSGTVVVLQSGGGLRSLFFVSLLASASGIVLSAVICRRYLALHSMNRLSQSERRELWRYASRTQMSTLTSLASIQLDALVIAAILPVKYVGIYVAGASVANATRMVPLYALGPLFTKFAVDHAEGGLDRAIAGYRRLAPLWVSAASAYSIVGLASLGFGVRAWLGPGHAQSAYVAVFVFLGYGINLLTGAASTFVRAIGRPGIETRYGVCCTGLNLLLTIPLTIMFGLFGVLLSTVVGVSAGSIYLFRLLRQEVPGDLGSFWSQAHPAAMAAAVAITLTGEFVIATLGVQGVPGLLTAGMPALCGLAVYGWVAYRRFLGLRAVDGEFLDQPRISRSTLGSTQEPLADCYLDS